LDNNYASEMIAKAQPIGDAGDLVEDVFVLVKILGPSATRRAPPGE
jgi:hypothetical protein